MLTAAKLRSLVAILVLGARARRVAPGYFSRENLTDLFLANLPVLIVALGDDARHPHGRDRHLGRFHVRDLRRRCGPAREGGVPIALAAAARARRRGARARQRRAGRLRAHPSIVVTLARWSRCARPAVGDPGRVGAGPAGGLSVVRALAGAPTGRGGDSHGRCVSAVAWGLRTSAAGRALYAIGSKPRRRGWPASTPARQVLRLRRCGRAHRPGRAAQRRPLQPDSEQHRPRARDEGDRGGGRRRRRDHRRARHDRRHRRSASCCSARSVRR